MHTEPPLKPAEWRLREALRLDLEDEQKSLIEDIYHQSRKLLSRAQVPGDFEAEWSTPDLSDDLWSFCRETRRLREVNQALERLSQGVYGQCERCGASMPMAMLAQDTTRHVCATCEKAEADTSSETSS